VHAALITETLNVGYEVLILAQVVLGLAIVMGMLNVLNIAHGEFIMMGCYAALVVQKAGLPYIVAVPVAALLCGGVGMIVERLLIRPLRYDPFETLLATWGLGLVLREAAKLIFGNGFQSVEIPVPGAIDVFGQSYPAYRIVLMLVSAAVLLVLFVWYVKAPTAARVRAMVGNPVLAQAVGIPTEKLARDTFIAGTAWAGVAGVMVAPLVPVAPTMGLTFVINAFFALVVGGLGTIAGLITGSSVIGGMQSLISTAVDPTVAYLAVLLLSMLFLWRRPRGLFPRA
jgi:branched-subunit amino acid ABC-type transport system permease component